MTFQRDIEKQVDFWDGFSVRKADRATLCVVMLLSFIFATVLIAYGTQIQLPTMKDTFEHGNNSRIWFRDMPVVKERNNSEAAATRLPTLYLSFEKLRLTHFEEISHVPLRDIGDYDKGVWMRKSMIDALWLRLFDDVDSLKHVCHLRLGAGYMAIMYLEALPDAEITIYDTCDGDQEEVCNTVESFLRINYPSRNITINRTSSPTEALVNENKNKTCDWIGLDFNGVNDAPRDIIASIQSIATCPNVLYANNIGIETSDMALANAAIAWEQGITQRVSMQSRCAPCYELDDSQCTFCVGEILCGAVEAEQKIEILEAIAALNTTSTAPAATSVGILEKIGAFIDDLEGKK